MARRLSIFAGALSMAATAVHAQTVSTIARPEFCVSVSTDGLKRLEARRHRLELEIASKHGAAGAPEEAREKVDPSLRGSQEELLQVLFRIECARSIQPVLEPPLRRTREIRPAPAPTRAEVIEVTTYYATNRNRSDSSEPAKVYGTEVEGKFQYGRALVTIPPSHTPGNLEMPSLWKLERQSDPNKHFVLKSVTPLTLDDARKEMSERLLGFSSRALFIFVHGYNTGFEEAAMRTAQIAHDLRFPGMPFFFSWPSANQVVRYWQDEEAARLSERVFEELIEDLSTLPVTDIYIVAHSMGNRIVGHALQHRAEKGKETKQVRELLLAAPDINANIFRTIIAPRLAAMQGTRTTIYAASSDVALLASKVVHGFKRVGDASGGVFVYPGIDTVDASSAASAMRGYGHIYVVDNASVMSDVRAIVDRKGAALARGLTAVGVSPDLYWRLP
jgi:esterase/lipase superfamily enzyme